MTAATSEKHNAYNVHQQVRSDREIDARALLGCANQLAQAETSQDFAFYTDALKRNQRLWTFFQVALCDPDNPLPPEIKSILLGLSQRVDRISFKAIAEHKPELLAELIDINRRIAAGLSAKPKTEAPALPENTSVMTTA